MEFLRSFLRRHLLGKPVAALRYVGYFLAYSFKYLAFFFLNKMFRLSGEWVIESPNIYLKQAVYLNFRLHLHQSAFYLKHAIKALL